MGVEKMFVGAWLATVFVLVRGDGGAHHAQVTTVEDSSGAGTLTSVHSSSNTGNDAALASIAKALEDNPGLAAAAASALGGGGGGSTGGYSYPSYAQQPFGGGAGLGGLGGLAGLAGGLGGLGGLGGGLPFGGGLGGFGKGFHLNVDSGIGGIGGGYFPIIEKVIVIVGGGILILLIIAFIQASLGVGGFLNSLAGSFSKAVAGSASLDVGPFHNSIAGSGAVNLNDGVHVGGGRLNDPRFNQNVNNAINRRY